MVQIYKKMMKLLDKKQKRTMVLIVFMMLIGAILEALGISVIVPIVQIVMDEKALEEPGIVKSIYDFLGLTSQTQFTLVILGAMAAIFAIKNPALIVNAVISASNLVFFFNIFIPLISIKILKKINLICLYLYIFTKRKMINLLFK